MRLLVYAALAGILLLGASLWFASEAPEAVRPAEETAANAFPGGASSADESPVFTIIDVNTYEVRGRNEREILASMRAGGPKTEGSDFFGLTETQLAYRYWKKQGEAECSLYQIRIDINVTITLPRWDAPSDTPYELRRDWRRFESALRRHEDGHREIAEWGAREVYDALANLRTPTCAGIDAAARTAAQRVREMGEERQHRFDQQNGHGRTQGAYWPQSARSMAGRR